MMQFLAIGCSNATPISVEAPVGSRYIQSVEGIEVEFIAADWRGGQETWVTVCYETPTDADWLPGRLPEDVTLSSGSVSVPISSLVLVGWRVATEGRLPQRCDRIHFRLPEVSTQSEYTLTIHQIAADLPDDPDWAELQQRLDASSTGIRIEPMPDAEGFSFALVEKPETMSDLEAHNVVVDMAGDVVKGPWVFTFSFK
jgi:hypothetical protein